jgi:hypothetical protein
MPERKECRIGLKVVIDHKAKYYFTGTLRP